MAKKKAATKSTGPKPARKKRTVNKSAEIRAHHAEHPDASPAAVVDALGARGITVTAQQVSQVKWAARSKPGGPKKKARRGRPPGSTKAKAAAAGKSTAGDSSAYDSLLAAKALADKLGSVDAARKALDRLANLQKK